MAGDRDPAEQHSGDQTTVHVRGALAGDAASRSWVVERFTPLLRLQLAHRLHGAARNYCDPEDILQEVWSIALHRMPALEARDGRWTPVLVRFLSTTLMHTINDALRRYLRDERPRREHSRLPGDGLVARVDPDAPSRAAPPALAAANEARARVEEAIDELSPRDREIVTLRGIEQLSNKQIAERLGETEAAVSVRYRRALDRLRRSLPGGGFDDLPDERI